MNMDNLMNMVIVWIAYNKSNKSMNRLNSHAINVRIVPQIERGHNVGHGIFTWMYASLSEASNSLYYYQKGYRIWYTIEMLYSISIYKLPISQWHVSMLLDNHTCW